MNIFQELQEELKELRESPEITIMDDVPYSEGDSVQVICPTCGLNVGDGLVFCPECGSKLKEE